MILWCKCSHNSREMTDWYFLHSVPHLRQSLASGLFSGQLPLHLWALFTAGTTLETNDNLPTLIPSSKRTQFTSVPISFFPSCSFFPHLLCAPAYWEGKSLVVEYLWRQLNVCSSFECNQATDEACSDRFWYYLLLHRCMKCCIIN